MSTNWKSLKGLGKPIKQKSKKINLKFKKLKKQKERKSIVTFGGYQKYIRSSKWFNKRKKYIKNFGFDCYCCEKEARHLHHITYKRLGCENMKDLVPLCYNCHEQVHIIEMDKESKLKEAHIHYKQILQINNELALA